MVTVPLQLSWPVSIPLTVGVVLTPGEVSPNWGVLWIPFLVLLMAGLGLGFGIIISSLTTKYRDLQHLVTFGVCRLRRLLNHDLPNLALFGITLGSAAMR